MGRLELLLLELLSMNTCAKPGEHMAQSAKKANLSKAFRGNYGAPSNISDPPFEHALEVLITASI